MRAAPTAILASVAVALVVSGGYVLWRIRGPAGEPVGFPDDARGVVGGSEGIATSESPSGPALELTVAVEPRALLTAAPDAAPPCRLTIGDLQDAARVDVLAGARAAVPRAAVGGRHLVAFRASDGARFCRVVDLAPRGVVDVERTATTAVRGRVLDADGAPIVGVSVWAGVLTEQGAPSCATTGADGSYVLDAVPGGPGVPLVAWKSGRASRYRLLDLTRPSGDAIDIALDRAVAVDVVFSTVLPHPERGHVALAPVGGDAELLHYPFFLARLLGRGALGPDGTTSIDDLPAGGSVEVRVVHPEVSSIDAASVALRKARQRAVVRGRPAPSFEGTVRDAGGAPIAGATVRAGVGGAPIHVGSLLDADAHAPPGSCRMVTGADGAFRVGRAADGACRVAVTAAGHCGVEMAVRAGGAVARHDIVLPPSLSFEPSPLVRVHLRADGRAVRARRAGATFVRWTDREPFEVRLAEPAVVDVRVTVVPAGGAAIERWYRGVAIAGPLDLRVDL